jgi:cytochrome b pre-mRNA-processing protein 3
MTKTNRLLARLFGRTQDPQDALRPLWQAIIARAREPHWYVEGAVPDTLDGRFDMVTLIVGLVLLRIEESPDHARDGVLLTELFVADMDSQMRQIGFGDMVVGKQIGRVMSALGGRLGAYRAGLADAALLDAALVRNLWRGEAPDGRALTHVVSAIRALHADLAALPVTELVACNALPNGERL